MSKIYVATSWRNTIQPHLVDALRDKGHEVYDFRNPAPGNTGFRWSDADPEFEAKNVRYYASKLAENPVARAGFKLDRDALNWCDTLVLVLPCGRSAHLEAGYAAGQGKKVIVQLSSEDFQPELMYLLCDGFTMGIQETVIACGYVEAVDGLLGFSVFGYTRS